MSLWGAGLCVFLSLVCGGGVVCKLFVCGELWFGCCVGTDSAMYDGDLM
jgi:hypothetical protein